MPINILDDDEVSRALFDPKDGPLLISSSLLPLKRGNMTFQSDNDNSESVNCLRLFLLNPHDDAATAEDLCHAFGLAKCEADNQKIIADNQARPLPKPTRTYVGYVVASVKQLRDTTDNFVDVSVFHLDENGNKAHCHVKVVVVDADGKNPTKIKNAKAILIEGMFSKEVRYSAI